MQAQAMLFPLLREELYAKSKELSALELQYEQVAEAKDTKNREFNEELKKLRGQILRLSKEIDREQEERKPTEAEAPCQGMVDRAEAKRRRDRTGEYPGFCQNSRHLGF